MAGSISKKVIFKNPIYLLAFGLGLGLLPVMPGTFGTLLGVLFYWFNNTYFGISEFILIIISFILGIYICGKTARDINYHDHPGIVFDEVVGYFITMINIPFNIAYIIIGFLLFRFFDIVKPWPIRIIDQRMSGGMGIMFDDVLAGIYANILLNIIIYYAKT
ncbi:MAG: phosphatidylglycerophosphatase A [Gammaproteobacteria bacterium]|nr:phosphatidylglycerophosphatase A [Gammaproteobacteria bacterium]